jgi:mRNA-degrading endonuclease RelE of RelBE toxin-antitoxin system
MSYAVVLAPDALEDLAHLPPPIQNLVEVELRRLAENPTGLSRPSHFPYLPGQIYRIELRIDQLHYYIRILFRYSQDETALEIFGIAMTVIESE